MKLFTPSSRSLTRGSIRVFSPHRLLLPGMLMTLLLSLGAFAGGVWFGRGLEPSAVPALTTEAPDEHQAEEHFTIDRLGVLVGRLKSLESDVLSLRRMLSEHQALTRQVSALDPQLLPILVPERTETSGTGQGGLLLPPRGCTGPDTEYPKASIEGLERSEEAAHCLRSQIDRLLESVARRNAALMAIPSLQPVPETARLGSAFGNRVDPFNRRLAFHSGVDFAIKSGAPVFAAGGGFVSFAGRKGGYGKTVEIDHGNGLVTRYAHLSRIEAQEGEVVKPGRSIGAVGSTGRSTGPHLHFEVLQHGRHIDPQRFLALAHLERDPDALAED